MDDLLNPIRDAVEGLIDFKGQALAEDMSTFSLYTCTMVALVCGFVMDDIYITLWTGLGLTLAVMLLIVPPWPFYNKHPVRWLGSRTRLPSGGIVVGGKKVQ
ncbi:uncharacterized protein AB675_9351 [Cyphellophora attinorum]|uniref:Signal peptidase complex subunit 1 n=1 Tax=Cyphellophora attinorum TaxID=1664694 RepID=A0A0N0NNE8_9EURO|nr:uncharacterized protein AB675_9351 [Phialophora attinorum]KPI41531.1 hypothetical protein AB675_9351 [Phialophora attinorum]